MFFNEDPEHEARWEARERERLARWYQDRVKADQAEQKPLPTAAAQPAQPAQREAVRLNATVPEISTEHGPWIESNIHEGETYCKRCLVRSVFAGHKKCEPHIVSAPAAPQPAQPLDLGVMELAESVGLIGPASRADDLHEAIQRFHDLIVVNASIKAALHFADGLAQQPTGEKDALLRQALEALEGFANITNDSQGVKGYHLNGDTAEWDEFDEVDAASSTIEAIREHLGVKND